MISNIKYNKKLIFLFCLLLGIGLRYLMVFFGYNYDMESFYIVGDLIFNKKNLYASTSRYNYAPLFSFVEYISYVITKLIHPDNTVMPQPMFIFHTIIATFIMPRFMLTFHAVIATFIIMGDVFIAILIYKRYSFKTALFFIFNPVSIIISGYHCQFDNWAVLIMLGAIFFFNKEQKFSKKDVIFILLMSLSLIMKHVFFMFPLFLLFMKGLPLKKKLCYTFIPPLLFLLSFVPFVIGNEDALKGMIENVFLYRSYGNFPLLKSFLDILRIPESAYIFIYFILMAITAFAVRKNRIDYIFCIYLISMVAFSSAVANQYLIIPLIGLCVINKKMYIYYSIACTMHLLINTSGLCLIYVPGIYEFYFLPAVILFIALIIEAQPCIISSLEKIIKSKQ